MKRKIQSKFALALAILFTIFTLPMNGLAALADDEVKTYKDGTYTVPLTFLHDKKDEDSAMQKFNKDSNASIVIENGEITVKTTLTNAGMIKDLKIDNKDTKIESENGDERTYSFIVENLDELIKGEVSVKVPNMYDTTHNIRLKFDPDNIPLVENTKENETNDSNQNNDDLKDESEDTTKEDESKDESNDIEKEESDKSQKEDSLITNPDNTKELEFKVSEKRTKSHFDNPVKLVEKNGKKYIQMTGTGSNFVQSLTIDGQEALMGDFKEDKAKTYTMQFEVTKPISEKLTFTMKIDTKNSELGVMEHDTDLWFEEITDKNTKTEVKEEKETESINYKTVEKKDDSLEKGKSKVKQKGKKGEKEVVYEVTYEDGEEINRKKKTENINEEPVNKIISIGTKGEIEDGTYEITAKAMHENEDKPSGAASFINDKAQLIVKDGEFKLKISVPEDDLASIDGIQIEGKEGKKQTKSNVTYYTFDLEELKQELPSKVQYSVPSIGIEHDVRFRFVLEDLPSAILDVLPKKPSSKSTNLQSSEENNGNKTDEHDSKDDFKTTNITPDKAYEIDYTIKHEDGVQNSVANDFFTNKGILLEKDDKTYVQMTITEGDMVRDLKNKYGEALLVNKKNDGSIVVQLRVNNDLSDMLLDMHIVVPEGAIAGFPGYNQDHKALLVFDKESKKEIDINDYKIVSSDINGGLGKGGATPGEDPKPTPGNGGTKDIVDNLKKTDIDKPEFGSNGDNADSKKDKSDNPQTGDLTNIWLYAFLLAGSLLVLGFKFRRRTI